MAGQPYSNRINGKKGGRPKGSTSRPQLRDYMTAEEIKKFLKDLLKSAETDPTLKKFVAEQILGKAPQAVELSGVNGEPLFNDAQKKAGDKAIGEFIEEDNT